MNSLVNGVPSDTIALDDRGLQYGDGVFETLLLEDGQPRQWMRHMARLGEGLNRLGIAVPDPGLLRNEVQTAAKSLSSGVVKIMITRGCGGRGYQADDARAPNRIVKAIELPASAGEPAEAGVRLRWCEQRLAANPRLAGIKHMNRLEQVMARAEWQDPDIQEGLLSDDNGNVIEGTRSNLFAVRNGALLTPALTRCGVAGVMRSVILDLASSLDISCEVGPLSRQAVMDSDELFLTNSIIGIWPVRELAGGIWQPGPVTRRLQNALKTVKDGENWYP